MSRKKWILFTVLAVVMALGVYVSAPQIIDYVTNVTADFTDANFRAYVLANFDETGGNNDGKIQTREIVAVTVLSVREKNIESLAGIKHFAALEYLDCYGNPLTSLPEALPAGLTTLDCSGNRLTSLPEALPAGLIYLYCDGNRLTSLPPLPAGLKYFVCYYNRLTSLPPLPAGLEQFTCSYNRLTSLPEALPAGLRILYCSDNRLTSLPEALPAGLESLYCENNRLTSLPEALPAGLEQLHCENNQLTSLDVSKLPALRRIFCDQNRLTKLVLNNTAPYSYINVSYNYMPGKSAVTGRALSWNPSGYIFEPQHASGFYAVTDIMDVPAEATVGIPLTLDGTVFPSDSTNKTIVWTVSDDDGTGASITGNVFTAAAPGTARIQASITNGYAKGVPFDGTYFITVEAAAN